MKREIKQPNKNLLIIGAGMYSSVAFEIATEMNCFEHIDFIDDNNTSTPFGKEVIGTTNDLAKLSENYGYAVVAIGNPKARCSIYNKIKEKTSLKIVSLISTRAYVSPSATIGDGCIIEPMAVVHAMCSLDEGCLISAGAVINHASKCCKYVHADCNSTVEGYVTVPENTKIPSGNVFN